MKTCVVILLLLLVAACATPPDPPNCVRPWLEDAYKTGRAIPAPGPGATVPVCRNPEAKT